MTPGLVAFFAFIFAVCVGAIWDIFEFGMGTRFSTNMQKAMLGDPSDLTDTMWDMIVNTIAALIISVFGYSYLKTTGNQSFLERWIDYFIRSVDAQGLCPRMDGIWRGRSCASCALDIPFVLNIRQDAGSHIHPTSKYGTQPIWLKN